MLYVIVPAVLTRGFEDNSIAAANSFQKLSSKSFGSMFAGRRVRPDNLQNFAAKFCVILVHDQYPGHDPFVTYSCAACKATERLHPDDDEKDKIREYCKNPIAAAWLLLS